MQSQIIRLFLKNTITYIFVGQRDFPLWVGIIVNSTKVPSNISFNQICNQDKDDNDDNEQQN